MPLTYLSSPFFLIIPNFTQNYKDKHKKNSRRAGEFFILFSYFPARSLILCKSVLPPVRLSWGPMKAVSALPITASLGRAERSLSHSAIYVRLEVSKGTSRWSLCGLDARMKGQSPILRIKLPPGRAILESRGTASCRVLQGTTSTCKIYASQLSSPAALSKSNLKLLCLD